MRAILLAAMLLIPQVSTAGVFMCVDPHTGKKTFTDKACPTKETGTPVKVDATNFGHGVTTEKRRGTWTSDADTSVSGRANLSGHGRRVESARSAGSIAATGD